jgi:hypothetical protein
VSIYRKRGFILKKFTLAALVSIILTSCSSTGYTNHIYLIPEGYEGAFTVFFNVLDAPPLKKEGDFAVVPLKTTEIEALHQTEYATYAYALTSREKIYTYEFNNQYYYVDEDGNRTPIDEYCIHERGQGASTGSSGREIGYVDIQVTSSECGEDFYLNGNEWYYTQSNEAKGHWLNQYD